MCVKILFNGFDIHGILNTWATVHIHTIRPQIVYIERVCDRVECYRLNVLHPTDRDGSKLTLRLIVII